MKTTTIAIIAILLIAALGMWWLFSEPANDQTIPSPNFGTSSTSPTEVPLLGGTKPDLTGPTLTIDTSHGTTMSVDNFIMNGETVADVVNPGFYVLAGKLGYCLADGTCLEGAPAENFFIWYNVHSHFFYIILLEKPLGKARKDAEFFLQNTLGITQAEMCELNYTVGVPYRVDTVYVGRELGFSTCPGGVLLPEI